MHKTKIILPMILVTPLLFGCQNKNTYSFTFHSDYCTLNNKSEYSKKETEPITLNMTLKEGYEYCVMPNDVVILFGKTEGIKGENYTYTLNDPNERGEAKSATITLMVTDNINITAKFSDSDNNFRIDPNKFDGAVTFTASDIKYVQRSTTYIITGGQFFSMTYIVDYLSPTIYNTYSRRVEAGHLYEASEYYVEKNNDKYYKYNQESTSSPWTKKETEENEFKRPSDLSVKYLLDSGGITYEFIEDKYEPTLQSYIFDATNKDGETFETIMSFYNNQLAFLSYWGPNNKPQSTLYTTSITFTYSPITPKLPKVN